VVQRHHRARLHLLQEAIEPEDLSPVRVFRARRYLKERVTALLK
jgi:hypothetical protein